jgi:hypothetical protein
MKCRICGADFEQRKGRGRPQEYCGDKGCKDVAKYISLLRSAVDRVGDACVKERLKSELFVLANTL